MTNNNADNNPRSKETRQIEINSSGIHITNKSDKTISAGKFGQGWLNSTVIVALIASVGTIIVAYIGIGKIPSSDGSGKAAICGVNNSFVQGVFFCNSSGNNIGGDQFSPSTQISSSDLTLVVLQATQTKLAQISVSPTLTATTNNSAAQTLMAIGATQTKLAQFSVSPTATAMIDHSVTETLASIRATQTAMAQPSATSTPTIDHSVTQTLMAIGATQTALAQPSATLIPTMDDSLTQTLAAVGATQTALAQPSATSTPTMDDSVTQTLVAIGATQTAIESAQNVPTNVPITVIPTFSPTVIALRPTVLRTNTSSAPFVGSVIDSVTVLGASSQGITYSAKTSGTYTVSIKSGAYNTYPGGTGIWRTITYIYKNRSIAWGKERGPWLEPNSPDFSIGLWEVQNQTQSSAQQAGIQSSPVSIPMQIGDRLTFVAIDEQSAYVGNRGQVVLGIQNP